MHEDLLGYLLGALEPHEMRRVAQWLQDDPEARKELEKIERSLKPLEDNYQAPEPPPADLVSRTLANLPPLPPPSELAEESQVELASMRNSVDAPRDGAIRWLDWIGGVAAAVVVLGLLLPALAEGRFESRKIACQDQMRQLGSSLTQYVTRNSQERLPVVAESGREAFAGIYANRLNDAGLMHDPMMRWCPSLDLPDADNFVLTSLDTVEPVAELHMASVDELKQIQQVSGGHYAYTLGVIDRDQHTSPRFESRSSFAVMSDAPMVSMGAGYEFRVTGHSGIGINVLFEDGSVRFFPISSLDSMPDHIWRNHRGNVEAGVNVDDASLAPSYRPPFVTVDQR
ncbi:MAG: H-X9-DG-CTERM domain-containing protein [Planctomycetota bacterium]